MAGALLRACALTALLSGLLPAPAASWAAPASWKVVHQQTDDSYGTAARPSIRYSHAAVVVGDDMVTSHGYFYDRQKRSEPVWLSDLWVMDLKPRYRWSRLRGNVSQSEVVGAYGAGHLPSAPSGRFGHSLVALNSRALYLYGGQDGGYSRHGQNNYVPGFEFEELWRLDLPALSWSHVPLAAEGTASPGAR